MSLDSEHSLHFLADGGSAKKCNECSETKELKKKKFTKLLHGYPLKTFFLILFRNNEIEFLSVSNIIQHFLNLGSNALLERYTTILHKNKSKIYFKLRTEAYTSTLSLLTDWLTDWLTTNLTKMKKSYSGQTLTRFQAPPVTLLGGNRIHLDDFYNNKLKTINLLYIDLCAILVRISY